MWSDENRCALLLIVKKSAAKGRTKQEIGTDTWKEEASRILKEQEFVFFGYREMLTKPQWELFKALAADGVVYQPTSSGFITKYKLGNASTVRRSLTSLQKMELILHESDPDGKS